VKARKLAVDGALEFTPQVFRDPRGLVVAPYHEAAFAAARERPLFPVAQTLHSESRRSVVRGVHFTRTPPGSAKYVYCAAGAALDIVVDIRMGSPTFGRWDAVHLDRRTFRSLYVPVGVGHAFVALEDSTVMCYLLSAVYVPDDELALSPLDPQLGLPIPGGVDPVLSERDEFAPGLRQAEADGLLPDYRECQEIDAGLTSRLVAAASTRG
jgi:epimerase EvaD